MNDQKERRNDRSRDRDKERRKGSGDRDRERSKGRSRDRDRERRKDRSKERGSSRSRDRNGKHDRVQRSDHSRHRSSRKESRERSSSSRREREKRQERDHSRGGDREGRDSRHHSGNDGRIPRSRGMHRSQSRDDTRNRSGHYQPLPPNARRSERDLPPPPDTIRCQRDSSFLPPQLNARGSERDLPPPPPPDTRRRQRDSSLLPPPLNARRLETDLPHLSQEPPIPFTPPEMPSTSNVRDSSDPSSGNVSSARKRLWSGNVDDSCGSEDPSKRYRIDKSRERDYERQQHQRQRNSDNARGSSSLMEQMNQEPNPSPVPRTPPYPYPISPTNSAPPKGVVEGRGRDNNRGRGVARGRGEARGRGRGGRGGRGAGRGARIRVENDETVRTREENMSKKKATIVNGSRAVQLYANFYKVIGRPNWCIYHYNVSFDPHEEDTKIRKEMLRTFGATLGAYIFDGSSLYKSTTLNPDPMTLTFHRLSDHKETKMTIRLVGEVAPTDAAYLQFFNILVRKCLEIMDLEEMGRHFYDHTQGIIIDAHHLELWPGYKTSIRNYEHDILLGVELTYKVLRRDNCLQVIKNMNSGNFDRRRIKDALVGSIVMTNYNNKTYRIDDMDWDSSPLQKFELNKGEWTTYIDYYLTRYGENGQIRDQHQPMLISRPKKKDFHRGNTGPLYLVPELCRMTGLTNQMRENMNLMRALATHLHTSPATRVDKLRKFMQRLQATPTIQEELQRWDLRFHKNMIDFEGHVIPKQMIVLGDGQHEEPSDSYDWGQAFRTKPMLSSVPLKNWVILVPGLNANVAGKLVTKMQYVSRPLKFEIFTPLEIRRLGDARPIDYAKAVDMVMNEHGATIQMIFAILPTQKPETYAAVKKRACIEFGVPSQCIVLKNALNEKAFTSICSKLVVQMNAKLGGEPWTVTLPLNNLMVIGFDVHHCGKRRGSSVGAMVASTSQTLAKYFSTVSYHNGMDDFSEKMGTDFTKCLNAYQKINNELPGRIIMYRDGVGDGQLKYVFEIELKKILASIDSVYNGAGQSIPKFSFIVVTKRINTRIFEMNSGQQPVNPGPGTVADDVITKPERYDFYLISQYCRHGTVSPISYNVLHDRQGLDADKMQRLTFKLCHMYFNWSGTVTVPAPCQYARKLAYLTGVALGGPSHERLSNMLYYL